MQSGNTHLTRHLSLSILSLFAIGAPMGCDEATTPDTDGEAVSPDEAVAELAESAEGPRVGRLEIRVDGQLRPDLLLAEVQADPDTALYFVRSDADDDGNIPVSVTIVGRDGGFDYGRLLMEEDATPLELYLAVTDHQKPVPELLQLAHDREVAGKRPAGEGPRPLAVPGSDPLSVDDDLIAGLSSFTCLSWANFQEYVAGVYDGAPYRDEITKAPTGVDDVVRPFAAPNSVYYDSHKVEMVGCNWNSSNDPDYEDSLSIHHCVWTGIGPGMSEDCDGYLGGLQDGWYLRRIYGPVVGYRHYVSEVDSLSRTPLQSYLGIIKKNT